ncbi:hypothetical protein BGZ83_009627 [Gryganskiella cystojenkinii]|nr:hypothetical protein BGZ83_009627 [Gryganskiella cystojenkinii]
MGKLTSLLKKKKSKGEEPTSSSFSGNGIQSQNKPSSVSSVSGVSAEGTTLPFSLNIRTDNRLSVSSPSPVVSETPQLSLSLMDDIMDGLAGTTPDTPQPTQLMSKDFTDFGLAFELSRQLDLGTTSHTADLSSSNSIRDASQTNNSSNNNTSSSNPSNSTSSDSSRANLALTKSVGKLGQNSAFKDNAFLRSQQQPTATTTAPSLQTPSTPTQTNSDNNNATTSASSFLRGSLTKNTDEKKAEAAAKLREASKKANAQLPSDDEGSDTSEVENSDDEELSPRKQRQLQQRLIQQQQQQALLQQQQQLLLEQQQLQEHLVDGSIVKSRRGSGNNWPPGTKPGEVNHEAVIDRMKDRHRAVLAGAQAAAMDDYYEEYMDEYGRIPQHPQQLQQPPGPIAYNKQYGMDPNMMYMDDYRIQQQQQQMYYTQGIPQHNIANVMPYGHRHHHHHPSMSGYAYNTMPTAVPIGPQGYQPALIQGAPYAGLMNQMAQFHGVLPYDHRHGSSTAASSEVSGPTMGNIDQNVSPRRNSRQQSTTSSSARASEDSWAPGSEPYTHHYHHHHHHIAAQKSLLSDSGYGGSGDLHDHTVFDDSVDDLQSTLGGSDYDKTAMISKEIKLVDVANVVQVLAIGDRADSDNTESGPSNSITAAEESLEPLKDSNTAVESLNGKTFKESSTLSSTALSALEGHDHDEDDEEADDEEDGDEESSDDDQPIILSRRNSANRQFQPPKINTVIINGIEYPEDSVITPVSNESNNSILSNPNVPYLTHNKNVYQTIQPTSIPSHMYTPQQQQQQQQQQQSPYGPAPMGYQFPSPPVSSNAGAVMGHQHSYSVDRIMPSGVVINGSIPPGGPMGQPMVQHIARRAVVPQNGGYIQSAGQKQTNINNNSNSGNGTGSPTQSPYPIPPTTLLHPGPRRSQSVRTRPQTQKLPMRVDTPARQQQQQLLQQQSQVARNRASIDFVRVPNGGYQVMEYNGGNFMQQQQHQHQSYSMQQQTMCPPTSQQPQPGYYMPSPAYGYIPNEIYASHPHQQMYATRR